MVTYTNAIAKLKQKIVFNWISINRQSVLNLLGNVASPYYLIGEAYDG
jgi:hypothetical protein